jgi:hypothetical protein
VSESFYTNRSITGFVGEWAEGEPPSGNIPFIHPRLWPISCHNQFEVVRKRNTRIQMDKKWQRLRIKNDCPRRRGNCGRSIRRLLPHSLDPDIKKKEMIAP